MALISKKTRFEKFAGKSVWRLCILTPELSIIGNGYLRTQDLFAGIDRFIYPVKI